MADRQTPRTEADFHRLPSAELRRLLQSGGLVLTELVAAEAELARREGAGVDVVADAGADAGTFRRPTALPGDAEASSAQVNDPALPPRRMSAKKGMLVAGLTALGLWAAWHWLSVLGFAAVSYVVMAIALFTHVAPESKRNPRLGYALAGVLALVPLAVGVWMWGNVKLTFGIAGFLFPLILWLAFLVFGVGLFWSAAGEAWFAARHQGDWAQFRRDLAARRASTRSLAAAPKPENVPLAPAPIGEGSPSVAPATGGGRDNTALFMRLVGGFLIVGGCLHLFGIIEWHCVYKTCSLSKWAYGWGGNVGVGLVDLALGLAFVLSSWFDLQSRVKSWLADDARDGAKAPR